MNEDSTENVHQCRRCGAEIHIQNDEWFRLSHSREPPREEIERKLEEGLEFEDFVSEGSILCPDCHEEFIDFLGVEASA